ncbi:YbdD/YjiX family protein [Rothia santali]|uniref:YbdD/YjiX family protein n=1 Tax=Rothia santali TaxID=2949643 RepID=UPI00281537EC|nr:YbdD/YjiX family protein [Rothia santali]
MPEVPDAGAAKAPDAGAAEAPDAGGARPARWWRRVTGSRAARLASGVLGADKYARYLDYHHRSGCPGEPLSERDYWRELSAHQESHPQGRCC